MVLVVLVTGLSLKRLQSGLVDQSFCHTKGRDLGFWVEMLQSHQIVLKNIPHGQHCRQGRDLTMLKCNCDQSVMFFFVLGCTVHVNSAPVRKLDNGL